MVIPIVGLFSVIPTQGNAAQTQIDVNGLTLNFAVANRSNVVGSGGDQQGEVVKYANVVSVGGKSVDAVVQTVTLTNVNGSAISNMDLGSNYGEGTCSNARASSVDCSANFGLNMTTTGSGGSALFRFSFYESGTYTVAGTGVPVTLNNVRVTSLDLDTSGSDSDAYQFTDFTGFESYVVNNPTNLLVDTSAAPLVRFKSNVKGNRDNVDADQVQVVYGSISTFDVRVGNLNGGLGYYGILFQPETFSSGATLRTTDNPANVAPTAGNDSKYVANAAPTTINADLSAATSASVVSDFGDYQDADGQGLSSVKITALPSSGTLERWNGTSWVAVTLNESISAADLSNGNLRYTSAGTPSSLGFTVSDGIAESPSYTLSFVVASQQQSISVTPHNAPGSSVTPTVSATSGKTPVMTSQTTGVCTVSGGVVTVVGGVISGLCVIQLTEAGNTTYAEADPVTLRINVSGGQLQTIPGATTIAATSVSTSSATLNGTVDANGASTTVKFIYGTSPLLTSGTTTVTATESPLSSGSGSVTQSISGLSAGTYFFRVEATSPGGTVQGDILSFSISVTSTTVASTSTTSTTVASTSTTSTTVASTSTTSTTVASTSTTSTTSTSVAGSPAPGSDSTSTTLAPSSPTTPTSAVGTGIQGSQGKVSRLPSTGSNAVIFLIIGVVALVFGKRLIVSANRA